jgi:hypothetical protein
MTSGVGVGVGGSAIEVAAAVVAAVAFFISGRKQSLQLTWLPSREGLLGVTAAILCLAFLITGIGKLVFAGGLSGAGSDGKAVAGAWLDGISSIVEVGAAACATAGFLLSRRFVRTSAAASTAHMGLAAAPARQGAAPTAEVAPDSGEAGATARFCSQCGAPRPAGSRFCTSCGQAFV